jgi:hypothetical protein
MGNHAVEKKKGRMHTYDRGYSRITQGNAQKRHSAAHEKIVQLRPITQGNLISEMSIAVTRGMITGMGPVYYYRCITHKYFDVPFHRLLNIGSFWHIHSDTNPRPMLV